MADNNWTKEWGGELLDEEAISNMLDAGKLTLQDIVAMGQIEEVDDAHKEIIANVAKKQIEELFDKVGDMKAEDLDAFAELVGSYPHDDAFRADELNKKIAERREQITNEGADAGDVGDKASDDKDKENERANLDRDALKDHAPSALLENRRKLLERGVSADVLQKLDNIVIEQAQDYAAGKETLVDIDQFYDFQELLEEVKQSHKDDEKISKILDSAADKLAEELEAFESEYGIGKDLQSPDIVDDTLAELEGFPKDEELFAKATVDETKDLPEPFNTIDEIKDGPLSTGSNPGLSPLVAALQCSEVDNKDYEDIKTQLLAYASEIVANTSSLEEKDIGKFAYLLEEFEKNPEKAPEAKVLSEKKKLLEAARKERDSKLPLQNKEYQDIYNVFQNIELQGELRDFGREKISPEDQKTAWDDFREQIRQETEMYLVNTSSRGMVYGFSEVEFDAATGAGTIHDYPPTFVKAFEEEYALRLKTALVEVVYADKVSKGEISEKDFGKAFDDLVKTANNQGKIKVNSDTLTGWHVAKSNRITAAVNRLAKKDGYSSIAEKYTTKIKTLNTKLEKKHGKAYSLGKNFLKSAGWGAAYSVGGMFGPAGIAAVATASFAHQTYGLIKDFKKAKERANGEGKKLNFWSYMGQNKLRVAGICLGAASAAIGWGGLADYAPAIANFCQSNVAQIARAGAGYALAASNALHQAAQAYKGTKGSKGQKAWAAVKALGVSAVSFVAGRGAAEAAGGVVNDVVDNYYTNDDAPVVTQDESVQQVEPQIKIPEVPKVEEVVDDNAGVKDGNNSALENPEVETPTIKAPGQEHWSQETPLNLVELGNIGDGVVNEFSVEDTAYGEFINNAPENYVSLDGVENSHVEEVVADNDGVRDGDTSLVKEEEADNDGVKDGDNSAEEKVKDGVKNNDVVIDVKNLSPEHQHDLQMLFLRDPAEANQLLGQEGKEWMSSSELQKAWDNGAITDEQKAELIKFAEQRFDDKGNFVGQDAAQMEASAKAYAQSQVEVEVQPEAVDRSGAKIDEVNIVLPSEVKVNGGTINTAYGKLAPDAENDGSSSAVVNNGAENVVTRDEPLRSGSDNESSIKLTAERLRELRHSGENKGPVMHSGGRGNALHISSSRSGNSMA